jgi:hypothetical protein
MRLLLIVIVLHILSQRAVSEPPLLRVRDKTIQIEEREGVNAVWCDNRNIAPLGAREEVLESLEGNGCALLRVAWRAPEVDKRVRGWRYSRLILIRVSASGKVTARNAFVWNSDLMDSKSISKLLSIAESGDTAEIMVAKDISGAIEREKRQIDLKKDRFLE